MKKIVISGATGFVGRHLVRCLASQDNEIYVLVRKRTAVFDELTCVHQIEYSCIEQVVIDSVDIFYHLAWEGVASGEKNELSVQLSNIELSLNTMEFAKKCKSKLFVATGTVAEYAFQSGVMDFEKRRSPADMYGATKSAVYYLLQAYARNLDIPFIWAVLPSTFGEGRENSNILTYTITSLLRGEKPTYASLNQMWDFLYVEDVVEALRLIGLYGKSGKIYGVGSGSYKSLKEYVVCIRDMIDTSLELGIGERDESADKARVESSCVNIDELVNDTGFSPKYSFEEGILKTIKYYRKSINGL